MGAGVRRKGRWYALQVLYAMDLNPSQTAEQAISGYREGFELEIDKRSESFALELVRGVVDRGDKIDEVIQSASRNWRIERMSRVDRNILRLATSELLVSAEVPTKVVINEAVELAKRYGAQEAPAFVNGILDRVAHGVREDDPEDTDGK